MKPDHINKKRTTVEIGRAGEEKAWEFMKGKGYELVSQNYRYKRAEIDLILKQDNLLVFAEVKARKNNRFGEPEDAVNQKKADLIIEAAENYIFENDWKGPVRFDIISIEGENKIVHFEDAFS